MRQLARSARMAIVPALVMIGVIGAVSGCVVAPVGLPVVYGPRPVVVAPAPLIVGPVYAHGWHRHYWW